MKLVLVDRWRHRTLPRTRLATGIAIGELLLLAGLVAFAAVTAVGAFWVPLLLAVPLFALELWFDMRSRSRRLAPELAGSVGIGSVAAAIVLANGDAATVAAGAWLLIVARAVASLPFVRFQLRRAKHQPHRLWAQDLAQLGALGLVAFGVAIGWLPWIAAAAIAELALAQLVLARLRPPKAVVVGAQQAVLGLIVVVVAGIAIAVT